MAYAGTASASAAIRMAHVAMPGIRWPGSSRRARAFLMIGIMVSPCFLADDIGYGVKRLFLTADQIAARQTPPDTVPTEISVFHVACIDADAPAAQQQRWADVAAQQGWPRYPDAGPTCFRPHQALFGVVGLKTFNVACPTMVLSVADRQRWSEYATKHGWNDYPQAGLDCVDP